MEKTTFTQRVISVQSHLKAPKNQFNKFGGYRYRSAEDILNAAKPLLEEQELMLTITDDIVLVSDRIYVKATASLTDGKETASVTAWAREDASKKGMDGAQVTGSASSYARKYALNGLFLIDDTRDPDTTNEHGKSASTLTADQVIEQIKAVQSREELSTIWISHRELQSDARVVAAVSEMGKKYPDTKK